MALLTVHAAWSADREHQVKATFIYNFAKFIDWPDGLGGTGSDFVVAVYGTDSYGSEIDRVLRGKSIAGHRVVVRKLRSDDEIHGCRILVTGAGASDRVEKLARLCKSLGIVMVGESPDFAERGGTIGFEVDESRVRFDVNLAAARAAGLTVSSKMLSLAKRVYR